jgi:signal transduction histidine kinase
MLVPAGDARFQALRLGRVEDVTVTADHARVRQVLVNLIGNAVKFTPPDGSITVTACGCIAAGAPWWGEIRVADTGPGIAKAEQAAVFEPYYRSEGTAQSPGVGLGLAISHALVRQMGGELLLESEVGAGSSFIVRLPAAAPAP